LASTPAQAESSSTVPPTAQTLSWQSASTRLPWHTVVSLQTGALANSAAGQSEGWAQQVAPSGAAEAHAVRPSSPHVRVPGQLPMVHEVVRPSSAQAGRQVHAVGSPCRSTGRHRRALLPPTATSSQA